MTENFVLFNKNERIVVINYLQFSFICYKINAWEERRKKDDYPDFWYKWEQKKTILEAIYEIITKNKTKEQIIEELKEKAKEKIQEMQKNPSDYISLSYYANEIISIANKMYYLDSVKIEIKKDIKILPKPIWARIDDSADDDADTKIVGWEPWPYVKVKLKLNGNNPYADDFKKEITIYVSLPEELLKQKGYKIISVIIVGVDNITAVKFRGEKEAFQEAIKVIKQLGGKFNREKKYWIVDKSKDEVLNALVENKLLVVDETEEGKYEWYTEPDMAWPLD
jgi:hypothetical protein